MPSALQHRQQNGPVEGSATIHRTHSATVANAPPSATPQERVEAEEQLVVTPVSASSPKAVASTPQTAASSEQIREQENSQASTSQAPTSRNVDSRTAEEASTSAAAGTRPLQVPDLPNLIEPFQVHIYVIYRSSHASCEPNAMSTELDSAAECQAKFLGRAIEACRESEWSDFCWT